LHNDCAASPPSTIGDRSRTESGTIYDGPTTPIAALIPAISAASIADAAEARPCDFRSARRPTPKSISSLRSAMAGHRRATAERQPALAGLPTDSMRSPH
jgi:hypothetical protein